MAARPPWSLAPELPWRHFKSPLEQWRELPSFVIGEYLFIACALIALWHARRNGRDHLLVWIGALVAGTANDLIFMALPLVENFWQAQATLMITPRLPLYIPCVYVCFMYLPTVSLWRLGLPPVARALASGLVAILFYAPYDIIGAKFLWWTWHTSDPRIAQRLLGAPVSSSIWVITFVSAFALVINRVIDRSESREQLEASRFARGLILAALASTPLMVVQMTVLQFLDGGVPGARGLVVMLGICVLAIGLTWRSRSRRTGTGDRLLFVAIATYFATLVAIMACFEPTSHRSAGIHQSYGACGIVATDIAGLSRHEFVCAAEHNQQFGFACAEPPRDGTNWYTVCGLPHTDRTRHLLAMALLAGLGMAAFGRLLGATKRPAV
jgi:hypothetical protein